MGRVRLATSREVAQIQEQSDMTDESTTTPATLPTAAKKAFRVKEQSGEVIKVGRYEFRDYVKAPTRLLPSREYDRTTCLSKVDGGIFLKTPLGGTYLFTEEVFDAIIAYYQEGKEKGKNKMKKLAKTEVPGEEAFNPFAAPTGGAKNEEEAQDEPDDDEPSATGDF